MNKEGLTLEQIKEIYVGKINDTYTLNLAVAMLENYDELLNKLKEKDKEIERLNKVINEIKEKIDDYFGYNYENESVARLDTLNEINYIIVELKEGNKNET